MEASLDFSCGSMWPRKQQALGRLAVGTGQARSAGNNSLQFLWVVSFGTNLRRINLFMSVLPMLDSFFLLSINRETHPF